MAQIITYPKLSTLANNDLLIVSDVSSKNKNTNSVELQTLANFIVTSTSGITGSGTLNTIAMFTPDGQSIGDSLITQAPLGQAINVNTNLVVSDDLNVTGSIETNSGLTVQGISTFNDDATFENAVTINDALYDANSSSGTVGQVLTSNGFNNVEWTDIADISGSVTGSGTTDTIPIWTDGPNGVLGDSIMRAQGGNIQFGDNSPNTQTQVGPGLITSANIAADVIVGIEGGTVTLRGDTVIGDGFDTPDVLTINAEVIDTNGDLATDGQLLVGNTQSQLEWKDPEEVVSGAIAKLIPAIKVASAGGSSTYTGDNNIVELQWTGGSGTYTLNVPSATAIPYRVIRFVTDGTFPGGASHKINITAQAGETIDGNPDFEISKIYEGVSIWSTGTEWIVIQAKAH